MLHPLAQDGVYRLTADFDRQTLLDWFVRFHREIAELHAVASRETRRPASQDDIDRLDLPLIVGRRALRRPSVAAMEWLRTRAAAWWGRSTRAYTFALAFACAHRGRRDFDRLHSRPLASLTIWRWVIASCAPEEALRRAALSLLPPPDDSLRWFTSPEDAPEGAPDLMRLASMLAARFGQTAEHWLWEVSETDFWAAVCDIGDERDRERDQDSLSAGRGHAEASWWMRHRTALKRCEDALEAGTAAWLESRKEAHV